MEIVVFHPLTMQGRELLSSSSVSQIQPRMVQLVMERDSKCYKVLVVGPKKRSGGDAIARIFSSLTGKWSKPNIFSDLFFGYCCSWKSHYSWKKSYDPAGIQRVAQEIASLWAYDCAQQKSGLWAYDCASSTLLYLHDDSYPCRRGGDICTIVKDRMFVLHVNHHKKYVLKEYQAQSCQPHWIQVKVHECFELNEVSRYPGDVELETQIIGCQDFLLVLAYYGGCEDETPPKRTLLFDLSTSKWKIISNGILEWNPTDLFDMFELRWDAVA